MILKLCVDQFIFSVVPYKTRLTIGNWHPAPLPLNTTVWPVKDTYFLPQPTMNKVRREGELIYIVIGFLFEDIKIILVTIVVSLFASVGCSCSLYSFFIKVLWFRASLAIATDFYNSSI